MALLFAQSYALGGLLGSFIAGEGTLNQFSIGFFCEERYHGNENQADGHGHHTGVDGGLQEGGEDLAKEEVGGHNKNRKEKASPAGSRGGFLPIEAIQEGR